MKPKEEEYQQQLHGSQDPDIRSWEELRSGNPRALIELYERHYDGLYNYAFKICQDPDSASDCLQEVFLELWEKRLSLGSIRQPKPYIFRMLRNVTIDRIRKNTRMVLQDDWGAFSSLFELSTQDFWIEEEQGSLRIAALTKAIGQLSPRQKEIIYMRYFNELDYQAIAEITQLNYQSVRNLVHRALESLKKNIQ